LATGFAGGLRLDTGIFSDSEDELKLLLLLSLSLLSAARFFFGDVYFFTYGFAIDLGGCLAAVFAGFVSCCLAGSTFC